MKTEPCYSLKDVKARFFPSRSTRWIKEKARAGEFGDVLRDSGGWLIPESGIAAYFERHRVWTGATIPLRPDQRDNLIQNVEHGFSHAQKVNPA